MFEGNTQNSRFGPSGDFNRHLYTIQKFIYMCAVLWPSLCIFSDKDGGYQFQSFLGNVRKASRLWFKLKSNGCEFPKHLFACEMGLVYGQKLEIYFVRGTDHGSNIYIMGIPPISIFHTSSAEYISSTQYIINGNVYHIDGNVRMYLRGEYVCNIGKIGTIGRKDWLYRYYPLKCFLDDFQMCTQSKQCLLFNNNGISN